MFSFDKNGKEISIGDLVEFPYADYETMTVINVIGTIVNCGHSGCRIKLELCDDVIERPNKYVEVVKSVEC
jgi:hypothetical protein